MADNKQIGFNIEILGTEDQLSKLGKVEAELKKLSNQRKDLNRAVKEGEISNEQYGQAIAQVNVKNKELRTVKRQMAKSIETENQHLQEQEGSYNQLSKQLSKLKNDYKNLSKAQREGAEGEELLQQIDGLDTELKDLDAGMGQYQRNVGNYGSALQGLGDTVGQQVPFFDQFKMASEGLMGSISGLRDTMDSHIEVLEQQAASSATATTATETETTATKGSTRAVKAKIIALKALRNAWIATGIGAFVVLLGSLIAAFSSTQKGADAFSKVLAPLKGLFSSFIGFLQNVAIAVFEKIGDAISNPKQALIDLGNAIQQNVINRIKAFAVFGDAIVKIMQGKFSEGFKQLGDSAIQAGTGITDATDKVQGFIDKTGESADKAIETGERIEELERRIEEAQIANEVRRSKLLADVEKYNGMSDDIRLSEEERAEAARKALEANDEVLKMDQEIVQMKIDKMKLEQSLNDTSRTEALELEKLKGELFEIEEQRATRRTELRNKLNQLEKESEKQRAERIKAQRQADRALMQEHQQKLLELTQQRIDQEIALMEEGLEKERRSLEVAAQREIKSQREKMVSERGLQGERLAEAKRINNLIADNIIRINEKLQKDLLALEQEYGQQRIEESEKVMEARTKSAGNQAQLQELIIQRQLRRRVISEEEASRQLREVQQKRFQHQLRATEQHQRRITESQATLQGRLLELSNQKQTEQVRREKEAIQQRLKVLEGEATQTKITYEQLLADLSEMQGENAEEQGGNFLTRLFDWTEDEGQALMEQMGQLYNNVMALQTQTIKRELDKQIQAYKERNDTLLQQEEARHQRQLELLEDRLNSGQISQQQYNQSVEALNETSENRRAQINENTEDRIQSAREEAFERQKSLKKTQAIIDGAAAVMRILADVPKVDFGIMTGILTAAAVATTATQVALINRQEYARGGRIKGKSHDQGGVPARVRASDEQVELEGGEVIINKRSADEFPELLNAINTYSGYGDPVDAPASSPFALGGRVPAPARPPAGQGLSGGDLDRLATRIVGGVGAAVAGGVKRQQVILTQQRMDEHEREVNLVNEAQKW